MTADILNEDAPDVEDFIACWMQPEIRSAVERKNDDELPFCVVARISGADDPGAGTDDPVVQLDFYALGAAAVKQAANRGHRRMLLLAKYGETVTLSDDSEASADFVDTIIRPARMAFEHEQIVRYTARYHVGLSYVTD